MIHIQKRINDRRVRMDSGRVLVVIGCVLGVAGLVRADAMDLRTLGWVTPVRDQGTVGSCWTFGTYGSFESSLLRQGFVSGVASPMADLSEWHLATRNGFNTPDYLYDYNVPGRWGGVREYSIAYLGRGQGPVLESEAPYPLADIEAEATLTPPAESLPTTYRLRSAKKIDRDEYASDLAHRAAVKSALSTFGALEATMYIEREYESSPYYDPAANGWCYDGVGFNHSITLVGWDDAKAMTVNGQSHTGAWLIKNSWGDDFGDNGYAWVAYDDTVAVRDATAFVAEDRIGYTTTLQHQTGLAQNFLSYPDGTSTYACSHFTPQQNDQLRAVSLYTHNPDETLTVRLYTNWDDTNQKIDPASLVVELADVTLEHPGYHTIDLPQPFSVTAGQKFVLSVEYEAHSHNCIVFEMMQTAPAGNSYYTYDPMVSWADFAEFGNGAAFALKALLMSDAIHGDADLDRDVDAEDLAALGMFWSPAATGSHWRQGDFNSDGAVDAEDLALLGLEWNPAGFVPEPASATILAMAGGLLLRRRRRRHLRLP